MKSSEIIAEIRELLTEDYWDIENDMKARVDELLEEMEDRTYMAEKASYE